MKYRLCRCTHPFRPGLQPFPCRRFVLRSTKQTRPIESGIIRKARQYAFDVSSLYSLVSTNVTRVINHSRYPTSKAKLNQDNISSFVHERRFLSCHPHSPTHPQSTSSCPQSLDSSHLWDARTIQRTWYHDWCLEDKSKVSRFLKMNRWFLVLERH